MTKLILPSRFKKCQSNGHGATPFGEFTDSRIQKRILMREFLCPQSQSPPAPNQPLPQPASLVEQLHRVYLQIFVYILTNRIQVWIGVPAVSIVL